LAVNYFDVDLLIISLQDYTSFCSAFYLTQMSPTCMPQTAQGSPTIQSSPMPHSSAMPQNFYLNVERIKLKKIKFNAIMRFLHGTLALA